MKKKNIQQAETFPTTENAIGRTLDWAPLFSAFRRAFEWALDVAARLARDFPEEIAAVERVRTFLRKHADGQTADVNLDDVLFTLGLVLGAIERDLDAIEMLRSRFAFSQRLPGASERWDRAVPEHFDLAQRLVSSLRFATA